jgi:hypothetical protein
MIFLFYSLIVYDAEFEAFKRNSIYVNDLSFCLEDRGKWLFSRVEGGIGFDYNSPGSDWGLSDIFVKAGANRFVGSFDVRIFPIFHYHGRCMEGEVRNFSIRRPGFGFGGGLGAKIFWFAVDTDFEFIAHSSDPVTKHYLFESKIEFNPDTITFGIDCEVERFTMIGQTPFNSVYIKPKVIFSGWNNVDLKFGVSFLVFGRTDETSDNLLLREAGVNTGYYGNPPWKVCLGVSSSKFSRKRRELFNLRILLIDEEGNPASGLLSLADSGSFQIKKGEIKFDLPRGIYPLSVYADNCFPSDTVVILNEKTDILLQLREKKEFCTVEGEILDAETNKPLDAEISIENSSSISVQSNPETGVYRVFLAPGDYVIKVSSKGYYPCTSLIEVKSGKPAAHNFKLLPTKGKKR